MKIAELRREVSPVATDLIAIEVAACVGADDGHYWISITGVQVHHHGNAIAAAPSRRMVNAVFGDRGTAETIAEMFAERLCREEGYQVAP